MSVDVKEIIEQIRVLNRKKYTKVLKYLKKVNNEDNTKSPIQPRN